MANGDQVGSRVGGSRGSGPNTPNPFRGPSACTVPGPDSTLQDRIEWTKMFIQRANKRVLKCRETCEGARKVLAEAEAKKHQEEDELEEGGRLLAALLQEAEVSPATPTIHGAHRLRSRARSVEGLRGGVEGGKERVAVSIGKFVRRTRRLRATEVTKDPRSGSPRSCSVESERVSAFFRDDGDHDRKCITKSASQPVPPFRRILILLPKFVRARYGHRADRIGEVLNPGPENGRIQGGSQVAEVVNAFDLIQRDSDTEVPSCSDASQTVAIGVGFQRGRSQMWMASRGSRRGGIVPHFGVKDRDGI